MSDERLDQLDSYMEAIIPLMEELKQQKYLKALPNKFLKGEAEDLRYSILLHFAWLLEDMADYDWLGYTPREMAKMLKDISDVIANSTEPN